MVRNGEHKSTLHIQRLIPVAQAQQAQAQLAAPTPKPVIEIPTTNGTSAPSPPASPSTPITFTPTQLATLRSQISAWKYLQHGIPVPLEIQQGIQPQSSANESEQLTAPPGQLLENDTSSLIYPYNAYTHPTTRLATAKNLRAIVPSMTPLGLDPLALKAACERFVKAQIAQRIQELSTLPSTTGEPEPDADEAQAEGDKDGALVVHPSPTAYGKLRALIELKGLQLRARQQALCRSVITHLHKATVMTVDHSGCCRFRWSALRNVCHTEGLERQQRKE
ncbi:unnamed protein product [Rhizoctonia solani]|uniref:QLQ domain-containing protein n=1 Tax=Rhizoctonia solani TaxID=456999 RepID=A0A8H3BTW5_9AGAM|nr:unnamed protein product [Rhizoctonia solani]